MRMKRKEDDARVRSFAHVRLYSRFSFAKRHVSSFERVEARGGISVAEASQMVLVAREVGSSQFDRPLVESDELADSFQDHLKRERWPEKMKTLC